MKIAQLQIPTNKVYYQKHTTPTRQSISFGNTNDTFEQNLKSLFNSIPEDELKQIVATVRNKKNQIGSGWTSDVYKNGNYAIKVMKDAPTDKDEAMILSKMDPLQKSAYLLNKIQREFLALKYVETVGVEDSQRAIDIVKDGNKHYLVTSFVDGVKVDFKKSNLKHDHIVDMVKKLTKLEQSGFIDYDLQTENFFLDENKVKIIDLGASGFTNSLKNCSVQDLLQKENIKPQKALNVFEKSIMPATYPRQNLIDNPNVLMDSNIANFEHRSLHYYLSNMAKEGKEQTNEALDTFKDYLKTKAEYYHKPMAKYYEELDPEEVAKQSEISLKEAKEFIGATISHEKMAESMLSNPTEDVIKTELEKTQLRVIIRENAGQFSLRQFMDEFEENLKTYSDNVTGEIKQYFDSNKKFIDSFKLQKEACAQSGEKLLDDDNLMKLLYKKAQTRLTPEIVTNSKNKKISCAVAFGIAIIGGTACYISHKNKKSNLVQSTTKTNLQINVTNQNSNVYNPFIQKTNPMIFNNFVKNS